MITRITLNQVNSYKNLATLETDKKVNLIYGLNGSGKSTLSDCLYDRTKSCFEKCTIEGLTNEEILVYNQQFIKDYFYESNNLKGIFTLSKINKDVEEKIRNCQQEITKLEEKKKWKNEIVKSHNSELIQKKQNAENKTWEIKTKFAGGDRVLEYCLSGLMGKKEALFNYLYGIAKSEKQPTKTIEKLKKEVEAIQGSSAQKYNLLPGFSFTAQHIESNDLFKKAIIGNENSTVAQLITQLDNSDWVKEGLQYLPEHINEKGELCPFCQQKTINSILINNIKNYFDKTYENDVSELKRLLSDYESGIKLFPNRAIYELNPFIINKKSEFDSLYDAIVQCLNNNVVKILDKIKMPSKEVTLLMSTNIINNFNQFIDDINKEIDIHNDKIENKEAALSEIKKQFWIIMRWDYDQTLSAYQSDKTSIEKKIKDIRNELLNIDGNINIRTETAVEQQKKTVNIDEAIAHINNGLLELGIDGFSIEKHSNILYKIVRAEQCDNTFQTLSEGEKMIISFLYFRELCKGKKTATSQSFKKIVVIDDPISSLSHVYIFNIGQLIKNEFFNSLNYEQIFLLTHSLYFFYEMTDANHGRRNINQKLFRMVKNAYGSQIEEMKYEEIQNDYHSYWSIIKDDRQPPALIANCMRNIIEYFFNFIEKKDLNNVFQKPQLQATKYQAFCRYINRESHSFGHNIFDFKEFNYLDFKEALGLVFTESGYKEHYEEMIK
ncbi:MAG: AAA family ATPase [Clostridiaceae bacterium]|nr:AAA family ATPase [Clostridiaceae bacterium]